MKKLTRKKLKIVLNYRPKTGLFIWRVDKANNVKIGDIAGSLNGEGYLYITIDYKIYSAHHLAWFYMTGKWPQGEVHHKDYNTSNNKWDNLEQLSKLDHIRTRRLFKNNTSGITGVNWYKSRNRWRAEIKIGGKKKYLGIFKDFDEAVYHRLSAEQCFGWPIKTKAYEYVYEQEIL